MKELKILALYWHHPDIKSVPSLIFENFLPALKKRVKVHTTFLIYTPDKLKITEKQNSDVRILDIHEFTNAVEIINKVKPDIVFAQAYPIFIEYAISLAAKSFNIPVISGFSDELNVISNKKILRTFVDQFFQSSVSTDSKKENNEFMRRGIFFIYKYVFLIKTQREMKMNWYKILKNSFMIFRLLPSSVTNQRHVEFSNTLHWVERESLKHELIDRGFKENSLTVIGNPMYDGILKKVHEIKSNYKKEGKIRVLLATTSLYEHGLWSKKQRDEVVNKMVSEICKYKNEISLTVKIHPSSESLSDYKEIIHQVDSSISIYQKGDIIQFLDSSDVIIFFKPHSALIYSILAKKPSILCNFFNTKYEYVEKGYVSECKDPTSIVSIIKKIKDNNIASNKRDEFVKDYLYKDDGLASERLCDAIMGLLKKT